MSGGGDSGGGYGSGASGASEPPPGGDLDKCFRRIDGSWVPFDWAYEQREISKPISAAYPEQHDRQPASQCVGNMASKTGFEGVKKRRVVSMFVRLTCPEGQDTQSTWTPSSGELRPSGRGRESLGLRHRGVFGSLRGLSRWFPGRRHKKRSPLFDLQERLVPKFI